ncbi:MAG: hypothetical protein ABSF82_05000 [Candidatus Bathyarchaeia archaeon]
MKKLLEDVLPHPCPECGGRLILTKWVPETELEKKPVIQVQCDRCRKFLAGQEEAFSK